jgi:hypothetical protein
MYACTSEIEREFFEVVCTPPCALLALRFSETESSRDTYPETPARAWGSACRRGVATLSAGQRRYAVRFLAKCGGTPQLVYVVYKGLGALAEDSPVLRLSCKWWKQES